MILHQWELLFSLSSSCRECDHWCTMFDIKINGVYKVQRDVLSSYLHSRGDTLHAAFVGFLYNGSDQTTICCHGN